jgi:putative transposase
MTSTHIILKGIAQCIAIRRRVFLTIRGKRHYLWREVDQDDNVLDILIQSQRNKKAAKKFFRKLLKRLQYVPRVVLCQKGLPLRHERFAVGPARDHKRLRGALLRE